MADRVQAAGFGSHGLCPGGQGKDQVAIAGRMGGQSGPADPVMGGDGQALAFGLGQGRVRADDGNGRVGPFSGLVVGLVVGGGLGQEGAGLEAVELTAEAAGGIRAEAAELAVDFEGGGSEMAVSGGGDGAHGVGHDERADGDAAVEDQRGGAEPALHPGGQGAGARAFAAQVKAG